MEETTEIVDMALKAAEIKADALVTLLFDILLFLMWFMLVKFYFAHKERGGFNDSNEVIICVVWLIINLIFSVIMFIGSGVSFYKFFTLMFY